LAPPPTTQPQTEPATAQRAPATSQGETISQREAPTQRAAPSPGVPSSPAASRPSPSVSRPRSEPPQGTTVQRSPSPAPTRTTSPDLAGHDPRWQTTWPEQTGGDTPASLRPAPAVAEAPAIQRTPAPAEAAPRRQRAPGDGDPQQILQPARQERATMQPAPEDSGDSAPPRMMRRVSRQEQISRAIAAAEAPPPAEQVSDAPGADSAEAQDGPATVQRVRTDGSESNEGAKFDIGSHRRRPSSAVESIEERETKGEAPAPEIDVDELARRVYSDLRRRLAIEWERERGRR
ncbi:MAG: hypothetical protein ACOC9V_02485, partial [Chloroflexota bacterium]